MTAPTAVQRKAVGLIIVAILALLSLVRLLLLPAGDEGRQPVHVTIAGRMPLRWPPLVWMALLMLRERLRVARNVRLRLAGTVRRIGGAAHRRLPIVVTVVEVTLARPRLFVLRA